MTTFCRCLLWLHLSTSNWTTYYLCKHVSMRWAVLKPIKFKNTMFFSQCQHSVYAVKCYTWTLTEVNKIISDCHTAREKCHISFWHITLEWSRSQEVVQLWEKLFLELSISVTLLLYMLKPTLVWLISWKWDSCSKWYTVRLSGDKGQWRGKTLFHFYLNFKISVNRILT